MKYAVFLFSVMFLVLLFGYGVRGDELSNELLEETTEPVTADFDEYDFGGMDDVGEKYNFKFSDAVRLIVSGEWDMSLESVKDAVYNMFFSEIKTSIYSVKSIIVICLLSGLLNVISSDIKGTEVSKTVYYVTCVTVLGCIAFSYNDCINIFTYASASITDIIRASIPLITAIVSAGGDIDLFSPLLIAFTDTSAKIMNDVILVVITSYFWIRTVNTLSDKNSLSKLSDLLCFLTENALKLMAVVFMFFVSFERISSETAGGIVSKAAVSAIKMVPAVGGVLSGGAEVIMSSVSAVKNGIGLAAALLVIISTALPLIKISVIALVYKTASAVVEPVCEKRVTDLLDGFGKTAWLILSALFTLTFMYTVSVIIMLCSLGE